MPEQLNLKSRKNPRPPARVVFAPGKQQAILRKAYADLHHGWDGLANLCGIHQRTLYDWRREKYAMTAPALAAIRRRLRLNTTSVKIVPPYHHVQRAGRLGALSRYRLYGNPGTAAGRRKGGYATQRLFSKNPTKARRLGFVLRKPIKHPPHSSQLAEFIGIMLGDGHLGRYQAIVYANRRTERPFARHVQRLVVGLFGVSATVRECGRSCLAVVASSRNLARCLQTLGLTPGDKIQHRADAPSWIFQHREFMQACLRGLIDTDGTVFIHAHTSGGHHYRHLGLGFTSYIPALLRSVYRLFTELGFHPRIYPRRGRVFLYRWDEVRRYMAEIGTHNTHHLQRFQSYQPLQAN